MKAPFSGTITRWRAMQPNGSLWLQVLRRLPHGGGVARYGSLRSGDPETVTSSAGETKTFDTDLRIRKGDYVGIGADDFYGSTVGVFDAAHQGFCQKGFVPGLDDGNSAKPNPSYSHCGALLLYNVTLVR